MLRKKIFVITSRFPFPLDRGDQLRAFHQIKVLSQHFDIQLITLSEHQIPATYLAELKPFCSDIQTFYLSKMTSAFQMILGLFLKRPFQVSYFYNPSVQNKIWKLLESEPETPVFAQLIRSKPYIPVSKYKQTILDFQDAFSLNMKRRAQHSPFWTRWIFELESMLVKAYELKCQKDLYQCTIISEPDQKAIDTNIASTIQLLKNGVDTDYFNIQNIDNQTFNNKNSTKKTLSFVANLGYFPNVIASEFLVNDIYNTLDHERFEVLLAGSRPNQKVKNLASENVKVSGWLDDIRDAYLQSDILVAPIFTGSGQQNKILEALAMQVPVVTTSQVAKGINATKNELMIADTVAEFQACIIELSENQHLYQQFQANGRLFVEQHFSWHAATKPLIDLLNNSIKK